MTLTMDKPYCTNIGLDSIAILCEFIHCMYICSFIHSVVLFITYFILLISCSLSDKDELYNCRISWDNIVRSLILYSIFLVAWIEWQNSRPSKSDSRCICIVYLHIVIAYISSISRLITIRYTAPVENIFWKRDAMKPIGQKIVKLMLDMNFEANPIIIHVFSNGGAYLYQHIDLAIKEYQIPLDVSQFGCRPVWKFLWFNRFCC